jgi:hypothetical protein
MSWVLLGSSLIFYFVAIDRNHYQRKVRAETYTRQDTGAPASNYNQQTFILLPRTALQMLFLLLITGSLCIVNGMPKWQELRC